DLRAAAVLLDRHVAELFEQRKIDVRLDVAREPRVAVPIPGAPDVAALLDDPDAIDAELAQPRAREQPAEARADQRDVDLVALRRAGKARGHVRIALEVREPARELDVLRDAVGPQTLVALGAVLRAQCVGVETQLAQRRASASGSPSRTVPVAWSPRSFAARTATSITRSPRSSLTFSTRPEKRSGLPGIAGAPSRILMLHSRASGPAQSVTKRAT